MRRIAVGGKLLGRTIRELDVRKVDGINIIAVERGHRTDVEFSADYRFERGYRIGSGKVEKIGRFEPRQCRIKAKRPLRRGSANQVGEDFTLAEVSRLLQSSLLSQLR